MPAPFKTGPGAPGGSCDVSTNQKKSGATSLFCQVSYDKSPSGKISFVINDVDPSTAIARGGGASFTSDQRMIDTGLVASTGWHHYEISVTRDASGSLAVDARADAKTVFATPLNFGAPAASGFAAEVGTNGYVDNVTIN